MKAIKMIVIFAAILLASCSDDNDRNDTIPEPAPEPEPAPVACSGAEINPERLFLQQLGTDRVIIKWRGDLEGDGGADNVCFGTDIDFMPEESLTAATETETGHLEAELTGLSPDTTYYYSVGGAASAAASRQFRTSAAGGALPADGNTRIWIVGDSGVAGYGKPEAAMVKEGFLSWVEADNGEPADLFLMLGDNAYNQGTDLEHQRAIFEVYPELLQTTSLWPTIGNHEMGSLGISRSADISSYELLGEEDNGGPDPEPNTMPYLNIFTLPANGEAGGLASGTEQYYSFDYANVHVVSLDSQLSIRDDDQRAAMLQWLIDDLSANSLDWTIVIFHHPPYTKGSHDSDDELFDIDQPIFAIREEFTPVFEDYGVDLVYSGHSHIYERSVYLSDHTGLSSTYDADTNAELNDDGEPASGQDDQQYTQVTRSGADDKVVYTVAGNGGKVTTLSEGYPHPAHFFSDLTVGSVVIDVNDAQLTASFINAEGAVLDYFTMTR